MNQNAQYPNFSLLRGCCAAGTCVQPDVCPTGPVLEHAGDSVDVGATTWAYWTEEVHIARNGDTWLRLNGQQADVQEYPLLDGLGAASYVAARLTPNMTSNTAPSPFVASASSTYASGYQPWRAFDGISGGSGNDGWASSGPLSGSVVNQWIMINLGQPLPLYWYRLRSRGNQTTVVQFPTEWTLLGSNNGTNFNPIEQRTFSLSGSGSYRPFDFFLSQPAMYQFYRFQISRVNGGGHVNIGEIELYRDVFRLQNVPPNAQGMHMYVKAAYAKA
ncbi:MAG: discoidin domain-containing protein [Oscillospiraceae bacterium]|nr:discoidin domain-containing protein [Oscillospiraceae bacterium]